MSKIILTLSICIFSYLLAFSQTENTYKEYNTQKRISDIIKPEKLHHEIIVGYNFYTFDNVGILGLYPTFYTLSYRSYLKKKQDLYWELGWNYFDPHATLTFFSPVRYSGKYHAFNTLRAGLGKKFLDGTVGLSAGLCYKYGYIQNMERVAGVGLIPITYTENSAGLFATFNYNFKVGKRFVIEPVARYESYFSGVTSHYMVGLNFGYKF